MNASWEKDSAGAGESVKLTASYDAHDEGVALKVEVYNASDVDGGAPSSSATAVATVDATEAEDHASFTASWEVQAPASGSDGFVFYVSLGDGSQSGVSGKLSVAAPDSAGPDAAGPDGDAPPAKDYYYPPDEKPIFDYVVQVTPQPPADSGTCKYHRGGEAGEVLRTDDLVTQGKGRLNVDLSTYQAATDSPIFLEFVFSKDGHEDQGSSRAVALADPAPGTIQGPTDPVEPGDAIQLQVTAWNAIVYDTAGTGTAKPESDASRISSDTQANVQWRVGGQDVSDKGTQVSYTVPSDASADLEVEAFLPASQAFPAKATFKLAAAAATGAGAATGDWTAAWSTTSAQDGATVQMVLTAPGLAAGTEVTFEVTVDGVGSLGQKTAAAEDGKASADWSDWFHDELAIEAVDVDRFKPATFSFKASVADPARSAQTTEALTYADHVSLTLVDEHGTPFAQTKVEVVSPWGTVTLTTDDSGKIELDVPPGGFHVVKD